MTNQPEYTLGGEPLSVCATRALWERLRDIQRQQDIGCFGLWPERDAIMAEMATRTGDGWEPYGGLCVP